MRCSRNSASGGRPARGRGGRRRAHGSSAASRGAARSRCRGGGPAGGGRRPRPVVRGVEQRVAGELAVDQRGTGAGRRRSPAASRPQRRRPGAASAPAAAEPVGEGAQRLRGAGSPSRRWSSSRPWPGRRAGASRSSRRGRRRRAGSRAGRPPGLRRAPARRWSAPSTAAAPASPAAVYQGTVSSSREPSPEAWQVAPDARGPASETTSPCERLAGGSARRGAGTRTPAARCRRAFCGSEQPQQQVARLGAAGRAREQAERALATSRVPQRAAGELLEPPR